MEGLLPDVLCICVSFVSVGHEARNLELTSRSWSVNASPAAVGSTMLHGDSERT